MSVELDSSFQSRNMQTSCAPKCRVKWLKNKGAILIVIWSFLVGSVFHLLKGGYKLKRTDTSPDTASTTGFILVGSFALYPIGGWLGDTRLGRYAVIKYSMWMMWIGAVLLTLNEVLFQYVIKAYEAYSTVEFWIFTSLCFIMAIGLGGCESNIVQLGIDQLQDASATEITSFITWYSLTFFTSSVTLHYASDCIEYEYGISYVRPFIVALCLTIAICLDAFFHQWLVKERVTEVSLRSILNIVKYIVRKRKLKHMFTDEGESISLFDVAKQRYGGPFTAQQVENVRTFMWVIVVIATCSMICGVMFPLQYAQDKQLDNTTPNWGVENRFPKCFELSSVHYFGYILVVVFIFLYEFLLHPIFFNCLPRVSIINSFVLGTALTLMWITSLLIIESVSYHDGSKCIFTEAQKNKIHYAWFLLPKTICGFASILFIHSSFEFIWSQAPSTMKGTILGFGYSFLGLSVLFHTAIASPFIFHKPLSVSWTHIKLTCGIWYFLMEGAVILVALIIIIVLTQRYKKRNRQIY